MVTSNTGAFDDVLDDKTKGKADYGVSALRKVELSQYDAPLHVLDAHGIEVPHREYNAEDAVEFPTTVVMGDTRVHLHQDVREVSDETFGDFGSIDTDDEDDVIWTVVGLDDGTVDLTVVGEWSRRREVPFEEFADGYEPITLETPYGVVPRFGY